MLREQNSRHAIGLTEESVQLISCSRAKDTEFSAHLTRKRMAPVGSGATWTGSPKGVFAARKHHKPRLALNNFTAGVSEREETNRTRVAGHLDEIQGAVTSTL
jgi:hypothetical protein